jgi:hypothetical protein
MVMSDFATKGSGRSESETNHSLDKPQPNRFFVAGRHRRGGCQFPGEISQVSRHSKSDIAPPEENLTGVRFSSGGMKRKERGES